MRCEILRKPDGSFIALLPELRLYGAGSTPDEAREDLERVIRRYRQGRDEDEAEGVMLGWMIGRYVP